MMSDIMDRLKAEEARMVRLWEVCANYHSKHRGTKAAADFNSLKHAVAGREPVLAEAAAEISALRETVRIVNNANADLAARIAQLERDLAQAIAERDAAFNEGVDKVMDYASELDGTLNWRLEFAHLKRP